MTVIEGPTISLLCVDVKIDAAHEIRSRNIRGSGPRRFQVSGFCTYLLKRLSMR